MQLHSRVCFCRIVYFYSSDFSGAFFINIILISRQFTLGKNERLKSRKLIERLFLDGKNFSLFPYRVFYISDEVLASPLQAGFGVSAKNFKRATDRNRIKRLTKEAYRLQKKPLQDKLREKNKQLALFFIYTGKELPDYKTVYEKMSVILQRLILFADEDNASDT